MIADSRISLSTRDANRSTFTSRTGPAIAVIAAHVAVLYGLAVSTGIVRVPQIAAPIEAVFLPEQTVEQEPEPLVKPEIEQVLDPVQEPMPQIEYEEPVVPVAETPMPPSENAIAATASDSAPPARELKTSSRIDPSYPPQSRRLGEEGTVRLRVLVDERGRAQEVNVAKTSGFDRLDQAAMEAVRKWRFVAATDGRNAVTAWTQVSVTFQLTNTG
jgi:periplasmic protein TonB